MGEGKKSFLSKIPGFRSGRTWKKIVASIGYLFILLTFLCLKIGENAVQEISPTAQQQTDTTEQLAVTNSASKGVSDEEQLKAAILSFEEKIYLTEKVATVAMEEYVAKANAMANGGASIYDVYSAASNAKDKCKEVQYAMQKLVVPKAPKEITKLLRDVKSELSKAYMVKAEALDSALKFLDDQKPSNMQSFKEKTANADRFIMSGSIKLLKAKEKAGIEILENKEAE